MAVKTYNVSFASTGFYNIDGNGNPSLSLIDVQDGNSVHFDINAIGHPFYIKAALGAGSFGSYDDDVDINGVQYGRIVFTKTENTPDTLYYQCGNHGGMWGQIYVRSYSPDSPSAAPTSPPTTTTASPTTTTPTPTTTLPPHDPPTTTIRPKGLQDDRPDFVYTPKNTPTNPYVSGFVFSFASTFSSNSFPPKTTYTNTNNQYRWGSTNINAGATWDMTDPDVAQNIDDQNPGTYHRMGGRSYGHFEDLGAASSGLTAVSMRLQYPSFHIPTKNKWHGINKYHATAGPNYNSNWHESFSVRSKNPTFYTIADIVRDPADAGGYYNQGNRHEGRTFARSPLHPVYNSSDEHHDYPYAHVHSNDSDFNENLPIYNGEIANPLSKGASYGPTPGLIFSRFYHYDATLVEGPRGFINHNGMNGAGEGNSYFTYKVTSSEPIARKSSGGRYKSLERVSTWSPYSGAYYLDFSNYNAYSTRLYKSSIWK